MMWMIANWMTGFAPHVHDHGHDHLRLHLLGHVRIGVDLEGSDREMIVEISYFDWGTSKVIYDLATSADSVKIFVKVNVNLVVGQNIDHDYVYFGDHGHVEVNDLVIFDVLLGEERLRSRPPWAGSHAASYGPNRVD